jgi:hypothetical protein
VVSSGEIPSQQNTPGGNVKKEPKAPKKRKEDAYAWADSPPVRERIKRFLIDEEKGRYDRTPEGWDAFEAKYAWLWEDPSAYTYGALNLIATWLQVNFAAISTRAEENAEMRLLKRLLTEPAFHPLFRIPPDALHVRLFVVRSTLEKDFRQKPELLLHAYEQQTSVEISSRKYRLEEAGFLMKGFRRAAEFLAMPKNQFETEFAALKKKSRLAS